MMESNFLFRLSSAAEEKETIEVDCWLLIEHPREKKAP